MNKKLLNKINWGLIWITFLMTGCFVFLLVVAKGEPIIYFIAGMLAMVAFMAAVAAVLLALLPKG